MNKDRLSPSNELLDRQDIDLLLKNFEDKTHLEMCIRQYFFEICQANDLVIKYLDFYTNKPEYLLRLRFWKEQYWRLYRLRETCLVERFQREYTDKNKYYYRAIMDRLCISLNLHHMLPKDFFYLLNCQESDFIKEIKAYLKMIKDKDLTVDTFIKIVPQEHRDFMFGHDLCKERDGLYELTDKGDKALLVPYSDEAIERYNLVAFIEALNAQ